MLLHGHKFASEQFYFRISRILFGSIVKQLYVTNSVLGIFLNIPHHRMDVFSFYFDVFNSFVKILDHDLILSLDFFVISFSFEIILNSLTKHFCELVFNHVFEFTYRSLIVSWYESLFLLFNIDVVLADLFIF